jgi:hypothetical protein
MGIKGDRDMKKPMLASFAALTALATMLNAEQIRYPQPPPASQEPPPVYQSAPTPSPAPAPATRALYVYDQKPVQDQPALITPEQAQSIIDLFRTNYSQMNNPRVLIYVNRELVDRQSGMKLSGHSEQITTTKTTSNGATNANGNLSRESQRSVVKNNYRNTDKAAPTLADRQTVRDVERLFGRPLRSAGATLVDQHVAVQIIGNKPLVPLTTSTENGVANKEREGLNKIADVVVEVLISSRNINVSEISGERVVTVPDIQATAIRLKDSKIIGQASAAEVMGRSNASARNFDVQQVAEATALALMEDIAQGTK